MENINENKEFEEIKNSLLENKNAINEFSKEIETIKKVLLEGKKENHIFFEHSNDISDIDKGMIEFHKKLESIDKSGNNSFLKYQYATLDDILAEVNPKLAEEGLYIMQFPINVGDNELSIRTTLRSNTGQHITSDSVSFKYKPDIQILGSYITYIKRYALSAILSVNLSTDTDCGEEKMPAQTQPTSSESPSPSGRRRR